MDLRTPLAISLLLLATLMVAPGATAAPCDASGPSMGCQATVQRCDVEVGANVITSTVVGGEADCRFGNMTRCYTNLSVGQGGLNPTYWCAF